MTRRYQWNEDKNTWLKQHRNISFEEIILAIQSGQEVNVFEHPNQIRYPGQKISVVIVNNYGYLVPFVESEKAIFLKTIIPSRKATKQYLRNSDE
ncbi:MAG: toxin [Cyanobacteria bacterium]|nr:toxin [Cyanobacteriota bacterium]